MSAVFAWLTVPCAAVVVLLGLACTRDSMLPEFRPRVAAGALGASLMWVVLVIFVLSA